MNDSSRRSFLVMTGAGAAVAGVAVAAPPLAAAKAAKSAKSAKSAGPTTPANAQPLVAHIVDPSTGVVSLLVGDREVVVTDHDLVARITTAAGGK